MRDFRKSELAVRAQCEGCAWCDERAISNRKPWCGLPLHLTRVSEEGGACSQRIPHIGKEKEVQS